MSGTEPANTADTEVKVLPAPTPTPTPAAAPAPAPHIIKPSRSAWPVVFTLGFLVLAAGQGYLWYQAQSHRADATELAVLRAQLDDLRAAQANAAPPSDSAAMQADLAQKYTDLAAQLSAVQAQDAVVLAAANPGHVESELVLAQTALDAGLQAEAKRHAEAALSAGPNDGRAQGILDVLQGKPRLAPRSGWSCLSCFHATPDWAPLCPACNKPGSLRWRMPGLALV